MRKIDHLLEAYGESHQNPLNKTIHFICVPLIFLSIVGLIWSIPSENLRFALGSGPYNNYATLSLFAVCLYYFGLSFPLGLGMGLYAVLNLMLIRFIEILLPFDLSIFSVILFVLAWIMQFYGHRIEGKKPSFLKDIQFLLIGPAWIMHFLYKKIGIGY